MQNRKLNQLVELYDEIKKKYDDLLLLNKAIPNVKKSKVTEDFVGSKNGNSFIFQSSGIVFEKPDFHYTARILDNEISEQKEKYFNTLEKYVELLENNDNNY